MRSVEKILREAWEEIKENHGVALTTLDFDLYDSSTGANTSRELVEIKLEAIPLTKRI